ncbi:hypothetical protein BJ138DRAFT_1105099, partial [Hygrophoropsis aurantiaca]
LPAGAPPPNQPTPNATPRHDDFWDTSDTDLPITVHPPTSNIPRAQPTATNPLTPHDAAEETHPPTSHNGPLDHLLKQLSHLVQWTHRKTGDDRDASHKMQLGYPRPVLSLPTNVPDMRPSTKLPQTPTPRVVKVSAAHGFNQAPKSDR